MRIMIVEDEIRIRKGLANLIGNHTKHTVVAEARNGKEAVEMALLYQPDLIITDIRMPEMDGLAMMEQLQGKGAWHYVVLSGYSEFEYARSAIRYGVDDYLIKPLAPEDIARVLDSVDQKLLDELRKTMGKPENKLRDFFLENETVSPEDLEFVCGYQKEEALRLICAYTGTVTQEERSRCLQRFRKSADSREGIYFFFSDSTREFFCLSRESGWESMQRELEQKLLQNRLWTHQWVWTSAAADGPERLKETYLRLKEWYPYGLVLDLDHFVTAQRIQECQPQQPAYPRNLKMRIQKAFYQEDAAEFQAAADLFFQELVGHQRHPRQVKEEASQLIHFLMQLTKENRPVVYEKLQSMNPLMGIGAAVLKEELEQSISEVVRTITGGMDQQQDISNYTIKRAIECIRNHYGESISLEGVADSLDITPEYLSTLFNREMGENFSVFLKKFRMSHARRLLKMTDKKIYEIAAEVGYSDPKYFNRVFKEEEGISPGDYRNLQK